MRLLSLTVLLATVTTAPAADELKYLPADEHTGGAAAVVVGDVPLVHTAQFADGGKGGANVVPLYRFSADQRIKFRIIHHPVTLAKRGE